MTKPTEPPRLPALPDMHTRLGLNATPDLSGLPPDVPALLRLYFEFNHLKHLLRQGWLQRGLPAGRVESVAEHNFGLALLAVLVADAWYPQLDKDRLVRLALFHEFGEVYAGDMTPAHGIGEADKHALERLSVERLLSDYPNGTSYIALWEEFEAAETPEARLIRQLDRLEMGLQAAVYLRQGFAGADELLQAADRAVNDPPLQTLLDAACALFSKPASNSPEEK
jgi:putative hydrolase of HD superfamily